MELSDILLKMADGKPISPQEREELRLMARDTQQRNAQLGNIIGTDGKPVFKNGFTSHGDSYIGNRLLSSVSVRVKSVVSQTIPTSDTTTVSFNTIDYNDGFTVDTTTIYIQTTGIYNITFGVGWDEYLTTSWAMSAAQLNGTTTIWPTSILPACTRLTQTASDERLLQGGEFIRLIARQHTGGNRDIISCFMTVKKIG